MNIKNSLYIYIYNCFKISHPIILVEAWSIAEDDGWSIASRVKVGGGGEDGWSALLIEIDNG